MVCQSWRKAAEEVAPAESSCRRVVHAILARDPSVRTSSSALLRPRVPSSSSQPTQCSSQPTQCSQQASQAQPTQGSVAGVGSGGESLDDWSLIPPTEWFADKNFKRMTGKDCMQLLHHCADEMARTESLCEDEGARVLETRLRSQLQGLIIMCADRKLLGSVPESSAEDTPSSATPEAPRDNRWDGWLVFALALATTYSDLRPFICRCAIQRLGESRGVPVWQIIELCSRMFLSLNQLSRKRRVAGRPAGFETAGMAAESGGLNGTGAFRLRQDLLMCICALEQYIIKRYSPAFSIPHT